MEQLTLKSVVRQATGKENAKKIRAGGQVPGTVYHKGETPVSITVEQKELARIIRSSGGENLLINLLIEGDLSKKKSRAVIVKEIQHDPVKRDILHVDFNEISLTEKIIVEVEVVGIGEPAGVKLEGGILDHSVRSLKIQCLPTDIPKHIDVDVSGVALNGTIHVRDLQLSEKIKILTDGDTLLFAVKAPTEPKAEETAVEGAAAQEPEVIREKKVEEGAAGEKAKEEPKGKESAPKSDKK
ncbi:MAG: 50S ribosomal protein L25 [Candidatus Omnitrophota bacterium]